VLLESEMQNALVDGSSHRTGGRIALGILAIAASVLWTFFFGLIALLSLPYEGDLSLALFLGSTFALGIITFIVGIFLMLGWFPGWRGWLVVGAAALCPFVPAVSQGLETQEHSSAVKDAAEHAYTKRTGIGNSAAECNSEYDVGEAERWTCNMGPATASDSCLVGITTREAGDVSAAIFQCERDVAQVNAVVARVYLGRSGLAKVTADCGRHLSSPNNPDGSEPWHCDVRTNVDFSHDQCVATLTRGDSGHVTASISNCDRDVAAAVNRVVARAYRRRSGLSNVTADCASNLADPGEWECEMGPGDVSCSVEIMQRDAGRITAHIRFC
jgi:hypothetical protein